MDACRCPQQPFTSADVSPSTQHEITASTLIPSPCLHGTHWPSESVSVHLQSSGAALKQPSPPLGGTSRQSTPRPKAGDRSSFQERLHLSTLLRLQRPAGASLGLRRSGAAPPAGDHFLTHVFSPLQPQSKARKPRSKSRSKIDLLKKCIEDQIQLFEEQAPEDLVEKVSVSPATHHRAGCRPV